MGDEAGEARRDQVIKGPNGFIKEFGLYPKVNSKSSLSFKRDTWPELL